MNIKPILAYAFHPAPRCGFPYEQLLDRLFAEKERHKPTDARYLMAKRIMNSFYGKSAELRKDGEWWRAGKMFNPCYAAEITARVRMRIYDTIKAMPSRVVSLLTDGIIFDGDVKLPCGKRLGDWELKHEREECVVLSSGVYEYHKHHEHGAACYHDGQVSCGMAVGQHCGERATRGFSRRNSLYDLLDTAGVVETKTMRPTKMAEAVIQDRVKDVGVFSEVTKKLALDTDIKRLWPEEIKRPSELLARKFESKPLFTSLWQL
jgi:hypothetical protein